MSKLLKTLFVVAAMAAVGVMTTSAHALSAEFKYNYFIGTINPKSWDGPWWWGLRSAVHEVVVAGVSGREVRSDRAGQRAFAVSFKLVNIGDSVAGKRSLVLRAAEQDVSDRWLPALRGGQPSPQPWRVGKEAAVPALAPGDAAELAIVVYQDASLQLDDDAQSALVELEISAQ